MRLALSFVCALVVSPTVAHAAESEGAQRCLSRLLIVTGLGGDATLEVGGDADVVVTHEGGRFLVFSPEGFAAVDAPWPQKGTVGIRATLPSGERKIAWHIAKGRVTSQSNENGRAEVVVRKWSPLDAAAWVTIDRVVRAKLPKLIEQMKEHRAFDAKKHMRSGIPNGWAETFDACRQLEGDAGRRIVGFVEQQAAAWKALVAKPVEFEEYTLVRRSDQAAWRKCERTAQCTVAPGPCGWPDAIAKTAKKDYDEWRKTREEQINCDMPEDDGKVAAVCEAGQCIDARATLQPKWSACKADDECVVDLECDAPIAINKATRVDAGYLRWRWWKVVDGWDRCSDAELPSKKQAGCVEGRCLVR